MRKVIIYCRRAQCTKDEYGYPFLKQMFPDAEIVGKYFEQRPMLISDLMVTKLIEKAENGEFDTLVVETGERIARNAEFILGFVGELQKLGVTIIFDSNSLIVQPGESLTLKLYKLFSDK